MNNFLPVNSTFEEMYKFLETSQLLKFTQKEIDNLNSPIAKKN